MLLSQLIFVSTLKKTLPLERRKELMDAIQNRSIEQNKGVLVTGILLSIDQFFIEILESSRKKNSLVLKQVMNNPVHNNLIIVDVSAISKRRFSDFPKNGCFVFNSDAPFIRKFIVQESFNPYELNTESLTQLAFDALSTNEIN